MTNEELKAHAHDATNRANVLAHNYVDDVGYLISVAKSLSLKIDGLTGSIAQKNREIDGRAERLELAKSEIRSLQLYKATADEVIATNTKERAKLQNLIAELDRQYMGGYSDSSLLGKAWAPIKTFFESSVNSVSPTSMPSVSRPESPENSAKES